MLVSDLNHMSSWRGEMLENYVASPPQPSSSFLPNKWKRLFFSNFVYNFTKFYELWVLDAMASHCLIW